MAWIESHQAVATHPKTKKLARILKIGIPETVGHLHMLWWWALDYAADGSLARYDDEDIADAVLWEGDPAEFVKAAIAAGFINETDDGLVLHDWYEYAGRLIDKRAADAARKRASRSGQASQDDLPEPAPESDSAPVPAPETRTSDEQTQDVRRTSDGRPRDGARNSNPNRNPNSNHESNERETTHARERAHDPPLPSAEICRRWNETVTTSPKVNTISGQREKLLRARWKEHPDIEWWQELFERITRSGFLTGRNERGWVCTFDWLIKPVNLDKLLGGNYDDREKPTPRANGPQHVGQGSGPGGFDLGAYEKMIRLSPKLYEKEAT